MTFSLRQVVWCRVSAAKDLYASSSLGPRDGHCIKTVILPAQDMDLFTTDLLQYLLLANDKLCKHMYQLSKTLKQVPSASNAKYIVTQLPELMAAYRCSCSAGAHNKRNITQLRLEGFLGFLIPN